MTKSKRTSLFSDLFFQLSLPFVLVCRIVYIELVWITLQMKLVYVADLLRTSSFKQRVVNKACHHRRYSSLGPSSPFFSCSPVKFEKPH
jgi:hypothetical protein